MNSDESFLKKLDTDLTTGKITTDDHRGILHREKVQPIADDWVVEPEPVDNDEIELKRIRQKSLFKKMFIGSCVFAVIALSFFGYSLYNGKARLTGDNVDVIVQTKSFADSGEQVVATINIVNHNTVAMELAKLTIKYPLGTVKDPGAFKEITKSIGTVGPGETYTDSFTAQLFGEQGTEKQFSAMVEYRLGDSNAIFESNGDTKLTLRSSIATLLVTADNTILSGQSVPMKLRLTSNSATPIKNTLISAQYPDGCTLISADPMPSLDTNLWFIGDVLPGQEIPINLNVSCIGNVNAGQTFQFVVGNQDSANERLISSVYTSTTHAVTLSQPFLATTITINGKPADSVALTQNQSTDVYINFENTTDTAITNARIIATLSGDGYDVDQVISPTGYFNTGNNTITWTGQEVDMLGTVDPGEKGYVVFVVTPKKGIDKPSTVNVATSVAGILLGGVDRELQDVSNASIAIKTNLDLITKTLHHSGLLKNTGPIPMTVGSETTFSVVWQLSNSNNLVTNSVVKTILPTGIVWKNNIAPSIESKNITYNTVTREVIWNVGDVPIGTDARNITFTVGITPTKPQVGSVPNLTGEITVIGTDSVTKTEIEQKKRAMNTRLPNDTSKIGSEGKVGQ